MASGAGLLRFDGTNFINVTRQAGLEIEVRYSERRSNGKVWFGLLVGPGCYDGTNVVTYGRSHGLGLASVNCTHVARDGAVWFAGDGGVSRFDGTNFVNFTKERRLAERQYHLCDQFAGWGDVLRKLARGRGPLRSHDLHQLHDRGRFGRQFHMGQFPGGGWRGVVWPSRISLFAVPIVGVSRFDGRQFTTFAETNRFFVPGSLAQTSDGVLWLPAHKGGVIRFDGTNFIRAAATDRLAQDPVFAMAAAPDGSVWAGTAYGVSHFLNGRWQNFPSPGGERITSIVCDSKGTVWAGSMVWRGLAKMSSVWRFDGAGFDP